MPRKKHYFIKLTRAERFDLRLVPTEIGQLARPAEKSGPLALGDEIAVIADTCFEPDPLKISAEFARGSTPVAASGNCVLNKEVTVIAHTCPTPDPILLATSVQPTKGVTITIPVSIKGTALLGIVDTAAQVTVIEKSLADSLKIFTTGVPTHLRGTGRGSAISAWRAGKIPLRIMKQTFHWDVVVAEISDDFILGLDLLKHTHAVIDLVKNQVVLGNQIVCATSRTTLDGESYKVSRVRLKKKVVIPPC